MFYIFVQEKINHAIANEASWEWENQIGALDRQYIY